MGLPGIDPDDAAAPVFSGIESVQMTSIKSRADRTWHAAIFSLVIFVLLS